MIIFPFFFSSPFLSPFPIPTSPNTSIICQQKQPAWGGGDGEGGRIEFLPYTRMPLPHLLYSQSFASLLYFIIINWSMFYYKNFLTSLRIIRRRRRSEGTNERTHIKLHFSFWICSHCSSPAAAAAPSAAITAKPTFLVLLQFGSHSPSRCVLC